MVHVTIMKNDCHVEEVVIDGLKIGSNSLTFIGLRIYSIEVTFLQDFFGVQPAFWTKRRGARGNLIEEFSFIKLVKFFCVFIDPYAL